jgi:hypothetical protein
MTLKLSDLTHCDRDLSLDPNSLRKRFILYKASPNRGRLEVAKILSYGRLLRHG